MAWENKFLSALQGKMHQAALLPDLEKKSSSSVCHLNQLFLSQHMGGKPLEGINYNWPVCWKAKGKYSILWKLQASLHHDSSAPVSCIRLANSWGLLTKRHSALGKHSILFKPRIIQKHTDLHNEFVSQTKTTFGVKRRDKPMQRLQVKALQADDAYSTQGADECMAAMSALPEAAAVLSRTRTVQV